MFVIVDAKQNRELTFREKWKYWRGFITEETLLEDVYKRQIRNGGSNEIFKFSISCQRWRQKYLV